MAGRHPHGMRARDERGHPVVRDAIGKGFLESPDSYLVPGFASWEAADEGRRAVNNAARHLGISCSSRQREDILAAADGTFTLRFRIFPKNEGRRHVLQTTGGDPANLAYNPFARAPGPEVDENGATAA